LKKILKNQGAIFIGQPFGKDPDFITAAQFRDEMLALKKMLRERFLGEEAVGFSIVHNTSATTNILPVTTIMSCGAAAFFAAFKAFFTEAYERPRKPKVAACSRSNLASSPLGILALAK
jgi:hypothetical protein